MRSPLRELLALLLTGCVSDAAPEREPDASPPPDAAADLTPLPEDAAPADPAPLDTGPSVPDAAAPDLAAAWSAPMRSSSQGGSKPSERRAILTPMSMTKRIQIPVEPAELATFKQAAAREGVPLAEWARTLLRQHADDALGPREMSPEEALEALFAVEAPVDDVDAMIEESLRGRLT